MHEDKRWTMIIKGKVAVMVSEKMADSWRKGDSTVYIHERRDRQDARMMAATVPGENKNRGVAFVAVRTPVGKITLYSTRWKQKNVRNSKKQS